MSRIEEQEKTREWLPKFDDKGLLSAVVQHATTGKILMVAFMDREAVDATVRTGFAHFHSRSRDRLWKKGEESGNVLPVIEMLTDCDQDAIVLKVDPAGPTCHTGAESCFYRRMEGGELRFFSP